MADNEIQSNNLQENSQKSNSGQDNYKKKSQNQNRSRKNYSMGPDASKTVAVISFLHENPSKSY